LRICVDSDLTSLYAFQNQAAGTSDATSKTEQGASKSESPATSSKNDRGRKSSFKSLESMVSPRFRIMIFFYLCKEARAIRGDRRCSACLRTMICWMFTSHLRCALLDCIHMRWVSTSRLMHARRQAREMKRVKAKIKDAEVEMRIKSDHFYEAKKVNRSVVVRSIVSKIDFVA
jgi:hypothetical protein